jgi:phosphoglycerate dehydrogenase-like enzyme
MPAVLITPEGLFEAPGPHVEILRQAGLEVRYPLQPGLLSESETIEVLRGISATIAGGEPYNERVLASQSGLRVIARWGVGTDRIDLEAVARYGVVVAITPTCNHEAVAEHTLAMLLGLARSLVRKNREVRQGEWERAPLLPLRGKTLGLIGLGRIGRSVALRAAGFRLNLLAYDSYPDETFARTHGIELVDLDTLLALSDYVSLHVPLTTATRGLMNRERLSRMKPGSFLVNTARGGLVVEEDLLAALRSGHLAGAGLDVFAQEPSLRENPLFQIDSVLVSPHTAGIDTQSSVDMAVQAARNIVDLYRGVWPEDCVVNASIRPGWRW